MKRKQKHTLLKGEGVNQHTLYGDFLIEEKTDYSILKVEKDSVLRHEQPSGLFSNEHKALQVEKGDWVMGKQVEFNPFTQSITRIWD
jgi:hypothetical protein